ncbi:MAG: hypothetical protein JSU72_17650 [Deltaproteobacteria bacterium]|nr:MAG: hypothetical protein JSU72_17650 [Deltaproteobacteria bacterium]
MNGSESVHSGKSAFKKIRLLRTGYVAILMLLFFSIVSLPYLMKGDLSLRGSLIVKEEIFEGILIALLILVGYLVSRTYEKELAKHLKEIEQLVISKRNLQNTLNDAFQYIGEVNVQIQEIKTVFSTLNKYPENKKDFGKILCLLAQKALGIVNVDWIMLRIINPDNLRTLREHSRARGSAILLKHNISNRAIVSNEAIDDCSVVVSDQDNLIIKAFCVLPTEEITASQKTLIKAIVNELEMLFIIFSSEYYKERYLKKNRLQEPTL